jgi:PHD/YefM family antitoxin component YafN of YafNO toxin-antitoxin module
VKSIGVTDLRQQAADVLSKLKGSDEPIAILQRSQVAAYLVDATKYEEDQLELRSIRRQLFLIEVREAEAEITSGKGHAFEDMEALLQDLGS